MSNEPITVENKLAEARETGKYLVAIWQLVGDKIHLFRVTESFPVADFEAAQGMLKRELEREAGAAFRGSTSG